MKKYSYVNKTMEFILIRKLQNILIYLFIYYTHYNEKQIILPFSYLIKLKKLVLICYFGSNNVIRYIYFKIFQLCVTLISTIVKENYLECNNLLTHSQ